MTTVMRQTYGVSCTKAQVARILKVVDPQAVQQRQARRLVSYLTFNFIAVCTNHPTD